MNIITIVLAIACVSLPTFALITPARTSIKEIIISPRDFLIATEPTLAHYKGGSHSTLTRILGEPSSGAPGAQSISSGGAKRASKEDSRKAWNSPPFFVKVGSIRFYGGLLTFGHELHPARICRVLNACIRNDGTVVLPAWMRRYDETLSFDCGIRRLE
eukprot:IDg18310t1